MAGPLTNRLRERKSKLLPARKSESLNILSTTSNNLTFLSCPSSSSAFRLFGGGGGRIGKFRVTARCLNMIYGSRFNELWLMHHTPIFCSVIEYRSEKCDTKHQTKTRLASKMLGLALLQCDHLKNNNIIYHFANPSHFAKCQKGSLLIYNKGLELVGGRIELTTRCIGRADETIDECFIYLLSSGENLLDPRENWMPLKCSNNNRLRPMVDGLVLVDAKRVCVWEAHRYLILLRGNFMNLTAFCARPLRWPFCYGSGRLGDDFYYPLPG